MSTVLKLYGGDPGAVAADAAELLENLSGQAPQIAEEADDGLKRISLAEVIGIATLVLTLPGGILAGMDVYARLTAQQLVDQIGALQTKLEQTDTEASLDLGDGRTLDLRRASTDAIVNALSRKPAD